MKQTVKIQGYLFKPGPYSKLCFIAKSNWPMRGFLNYCTPISSIRKICKEGSKIYLAFGKFKGKRKLVEVTFKG